MTGRNVLLFAAMGEEILLVLHDLRWMIVFAVVLIVSDFWFGISDSLNKRAEFRFSRAGRRTCNKAVDYLTYLLLGAIMGLAIFEPLNITNHTVTAAVGLGLGCLWEIDSIVGHICSLHGIENQFSIKRFLISMIKKKYAHVGEALEEQLGDKNKK